MTALITGAVGLCAAAVIIFLLRRDRLRSNHAMVWLVVAAGFSLLGLAPTEGQINSASTSQVRGRIHHCRMHGLKRLWGWISPPADDKQTVGNLFTPEQLLAFQPGLPVAIQSLTGNQQWDARGVRT